MMKFSASNRSAPDMAANAAAAAISLVNSQEDSTDEKEMKRKSEQSSARQKSALPWSMRIVRPLIGACCQECGTWDGSNISTSRFENDDNDDNDENIVAYDKVFRSFRGRIHPVVSPYAVAPMKVDNFEVSSSTELVIHEYIACCQVYGVERNAGVMATFRFCLPSLRVSGGFHDADMLALTEILLRHANGPLAFLRRLDFSRASKEGKQHKKLGFQSHGALCLAKVLQVSKHIAEVRLQRHKIGAYGATAIFLAAANNKALRGLIMRRCRIGERGGLAFAEIICPRKTNNLREIDLSANNIGFYGCLAIEKALQHRNKSYPMLTVDIEGNLVFQEIMNGVTHGLGVLFALIGAVLMTSRVWDKSERHVVSCAIYSASLLVLYISSTLFHSFFSMQHTKYLFEVLDKCAIYILIAGSYTPFLRIGLGHNTLWSVWLLLFIWMCCICGIVVEAAFPTWKEKGWFSLIMYLGMGWSCVVCLPDLYDAMPQAAMNLLVMGGVGYTSGVPFFVRDNNLDHSIWHVFVLAGSMFHWFSIYSHVAIMP